MRNISLRMILILLLLACISTSCVIGPVPPLPTMTPQLSGFYFPVQKPEPNRTTAASYIIGDLVAEGRCLRVTSSSLDGGHLVLWPPLYSLREANGQLEVLNENNQVVVRAGDHIYIDGGELTEVDPAWLAELLTAPPPTECPGPYWISGVEARVAPPSTSP